MKRAEHHSSIYQFLEASGVLESGTPEEIAAVKQKYWRQYRAAWRKEKRKQEKELTTTWNSSELKILTEAAQQHHRSRTAFIKAATLAYIKKEYLVPDTAALGEIRQFLALTYNSLDQLCEADSIPPNIGEHLLERITALEAAVLTRLTVPDEYPHCATTNPNIP